MFSNDPAPGSLSSTNDTTDSLTHRVSVWDGWRGLAITLVLCGHFVDITWLWEDRMGVDVFFVLSGMLMSIILFEKRLSLKDFYIRRLSRILPALIVFVVAIFLFSWLYGLNFNALEFITSLLFLRTYLPAEPHIWSSEVAIQHLWSLNVEEHAYILLSLISLWLAPPARIGMLMIVLALISMALSTNAYLHLPHNEFPLYLIRTESAVVFIFFSAGYGLLRRQHGWQLPPAAPVICFLLAMICYAQALPLWLVFTACPILLGIAVNHLDTLPTPVNSLLTNPLLRQLGLWSYSVYLWQQFFYQYSWAIPGGKITAAACAVLVGAGSYYLIENTARYWINNRFSAAPHYRHNQC